MAAIALVLPGHGAEVTRRVASRFDDRSLRIPEAPGSSRRRLEPPSRQADRDSLAFVHRYKMPREARATDACRIGRAGRCAPVDSQSIVERVDHARRRRRSRARPS